MFAVKAAAAESGSWGCRPGTNQWVCSRSNQLQLIDLVSYFRQFAQFSPLNWLRDDTLVNCSPPRSLGH